MWLFMLHRFYVGRHLSALIQIITGGGFIVWWLYDGYKIFTGTIMDKNGVEVD